MRTTGLVFVVGFGVGLLVMGAYIGADFETEVTYIQASPEQVVLISTFNEADYLIETANLMIQSPEVHRVKQEIWREWYETWRVRRSHLQVEVESLRDKWSSGGCEWSGGRIGWTYETRGPLEASTP